jgi:hypothetical protein
MTTCMITFGEIFIEYFWNIFEKSSYYFIKVHVKSLVGNVIFKKIEIHLQVLYYLKVNFIVFNECFC